MADIQCVNPVCQRTNSDTRTFCSNCGWRLPQIVPPPVPPPDCVVLKEAYDQLKQKYDQVASRQDQLQGEHEQLQGQHQQLASDHAQLQGHAEQLNSSHQALAQEHQQTVAALAEAHASATQSETLKQKAESRIESLLEELKRITPGSGTSPATSPDAQAEIVRLNQLLAQADAKIKAFESSDLGKATWPLQSRIISWVLVAVAGLASGAAAGIYSPLNPVKKQLNTIVSGQGQQRNDLANTATQLSQAAQELDKAKQDLAAQAQTNSQLTTQLDASKQSAQSAAEQLSAVKAQLAESKGVAAKEHAAAVETQKQLEAEKARSQQLSVKSALASALQATIAAHPYLTYRGANQGTITIQYNGKSDKPANITLDHLNSSSESGVRVDSVAGAQLPGVPVVVEPMSKNVSILSPPNSANGWQKMTIIVQGKNSNKAVLRWTVF